MDYLDRYACEFGIHSTITSTFVVCELINQRACTFFWSSINGWMPMLADCSSKAHTSIFFAGLYEFLEHQWNYDALWIFIIYLNQRRGRKLYHQTFHSFPFLPSYFFYHSPPYVSGFCKHSELLIPSFALLCNDISYWSCVSPSPWHSCISCIQMRHSGVWTGQTRRQRLVGRVEARQEEAIFTSTPSTATCGRTKRLHSPVTSCILDLQ